MRMAARVAVGEIVLVVAKVIVLVAVAVVVLDTVTINAHTNVVISVRGIVKANVAIIVLALVLKYVNRVVAKCALKDVITGVAMVVLIPARKGVSEYAKITVQGIVPQPAEVVRELVMVFVKVPAPHRVKV